jgi:elongation factor 1-gamma
VFIFCSVGLALLLTIPSFFHNFPLCSYEKAKVDLGNALTVLDAHLLHRTYLVGHAITCADIVIVSALLYPFKLTCDKNYLKTYTNVTRWFTTCVNQPEFAAVMGAVVMCKKELLAEGQAAPAAPKAEAAAPKAKKEKKKAEEEEDLAPEPAVVEKKAEHPYKIMDKEQPSPFSMDMWKKTYSNCSNYAEAMTAFWEMFDSNGWTLWLQTYNYNEDNKRIFMTANAIGGFQQRTDEIRKWSFGVQDVRRELCTARVTWGNRILVSQWSFAVGFGHGRDSLGDCRRLVAAR